MGDRPTAIQRVKTMGTGDADAAKKRHNGFGRARGGARCTPLVDGNRVGDKVDIYPIVCAEKRKRGVGSVSADNEKETGKRRKPGRPVREERGWHCKSSVFFQTNLMSALARGDRTRRPRNGHGGLARRLR